MTAIDNILNRSEQPSLGRKAISYLDATVGERTGRVAIFVLHVGSASGSLGRLVDRLQNYYRDLDLVTSDDLDARVNGESNGDTDDFRANVIQQCDFAIVMCDHCAIDSMLAESSTSMLVDLEIALNSNLPVAPVLVGDVGLPRDEDLPLSIRSLTRRNSIRIDPGRDFHHHVDQLIAGINAFLTDRSIVLATKSSGLWGWFQDKLNRIAPIKVEWLDNLRRHQFGMWCGAIFFFVFIVFGGYFAISERAWFMFAIFSFLGILYLRYAIAAIHHVSSPAMHHFQDARIFISYRRNNSAGNAGRIYDSLIQAFRRDDVFMDVNSIPIGDPFDEYLEKQVLNSKIVLAIVGDQWLLDRHLRANVDYVQVELACALERNVPVLCILIDDAKLPLNLPESICLLEESDDVVVESGVAFEQGMVEVIGKIKETFIGQRRSFFQWWINPSGEPRNDPPWKRFGIGAFLAIVCVGLGIGVYVVPWANHGVFDYVAAGVFLLAFAVGVFFGLGMIAGAIVDLWCGDQSDRPN